MVKPNRHLPRPKKSTLLVGVENILKALKDGEAIDKIYIDNRSRSRHFEELKVRAAEEGVPINYVPAARLDSFHVNDHGGCIAHRSPIKFQDLQNVISFVVEKGETPLFILLDGITDIRNIGAIARTAYCCGVHALVIPGKGIGALHEDAIQASAGALELLTVCRVPSLLKAMDELRLNGIPVYASEMKAGTMLHELSLNAPAAILMGSEDKGIYPALLKAADAVFRIPMTGDFESLNVSVATGMILYEVQRQRMQVP